jgi:rubrerythrin
MLVRMRTSKPNINKEESTVKEYKCGICSYKLSTGKRPNDLPADWYCPDCKAGKDALELIVEVKVELILDSNLPEDLAPGQLSALFGNLAKGCEKQYRTDEKELFQALSDYYNGTIINEPGNGYDELDSLLGEETATKFPAAMEDTRSFGDRGALRALTWCKRSTLMVRSLLKTKAETLAMIKGGKSVHVCQICGYVSVGDDAPERCLACGVPKNKIETVGGAA